MAIEHVGLSQQAKQQVIRLKRFTGVQNWNVLCRWALCLSLAEESVPPVTNIPLDSNVEMTWKVFAGRYGNFYLAILTERCIVDGLGTDEHTLTQQFRLHLHRGISYLAGNRDLRNIESLISLATRSSSDSVLVCGKDRVSPPRNATATTAGAQASGD